jgi:hypothetical protein
MTIISRLQALMLLLLLKGMCDYINIFISFSKGCKGWTIWWSDSVQSVMRSYFFIINYLLIYLFLFPKVAKVERSDDLTVYNPLRDQIFIIINYLFLENRNEFNYQIIWNKLNINKIYLYWASYNNNNFIFFITNYHYHHHHYHHYHHNPLELYSEIFKPCLMYYAKGLLINKFLYC